MLKLTVAFLATLAAVDAADARVHRQARREYGYGNGGYGGKPAVSSATPEAAESSPVAVPYVQSSAPAFYTSNSPADASYPPVEATPSPSAGVDYGNGYGGASSYVPSPESSSAVYVPIESYTKPAESGLYGGGFSLATPSPSAASAVAYPSSAAPSVVYPTGGYGGAKSSSSGKPVKDTSVVPSGTGYPAYPTGTGPAPVSSAPLSGYVTKTIYSTQTLTGSSAVYTSVVPVGTTVCKEDEYPEASSTPVKYITSEYPVSEVTSTVTETLVYTVGVGSTAHPVTTEVTKTKTSTIYSTVVVTVGKPKPTPTGEGYPVYPENVPTSTLTIKSTSTSTKYITVKATPSAGASVGTESYPTGPAGGKGEECAAPVTVTVTAKETVTVTKGGYKPSATPSKPTSPESDYPEYPAGKPSKPAGPEYPASSVVPVKPTATATPSGKYPIGNGTYPGYPAGPTGFKTSTKPAYPVGTGYYGSEVPTKPSETSSLPYFSFVSEVPYPTETPKIPSDETAYPSPTPSPASSSAAYPPAGGEYGSYPAPSSAAPVETPYPSEVPSPSEAPYEAPSKTPTEEQTYPTPSSGYGSGYGY